MDVENNTVRDEDFYFEESEVFVSKSRPIPVLISLINWRMIRPLGGGS